MTVVCVAVAGWALRGLLADPVPDLEDFGASGATVTMIERDNPTARLMEFAKINGQVQAETVQRVVDMVRASPGETVEVLRNWINDN